MTEQLEEQKKWDRLAEQLTPAISQHGTDLTAELATVLESLAPRPTRILEAGCGGGTTSIGLANRGFRLDLLDFSEEMLLRAKAAWPAYIASGVPTPRFFHADVSATSAAALGTDPYDCVFNGGVLEHYEDQAAVDLLRGMGRLSHRYVVALVPNARCPVYRWWRWRQMSEGRWPYGKELPRESLVPLMRHAGLRPLFELPLGHLWTLELAKQVAHDGDDLLRWLAADNLPSELLGYCICSVAQLQTAGKKSVTRTGPLQRVRDSRIEYLEVEQRRMHLEIENARAAETAAQRLLLDLEARWAREVEQLRRELRAEADAVRAGAAAEVAHVRSRELQQSTDLWALAKQRDEDRSEHARREQHLLERSQLAEADVQRLRLELRETCQTLNTVRTSTAAEAAELQSRGTQQATDILVLEEQLDEERREHARREHALLERSHLAEAELQRLRPELHEVSQKLTTIVNSNGFRILSRLKRQRNRVAFLSATRELRPSLSSLLEATLCWVWRAALPRDLGRLLDVHQDDPIFYHHPLRVFTDDPRTWEARGYRTEDTRSTPARRVRVSLIATVLNEAGNVERWMHSLAVQSRPPDEVVIVDGGSRDGTADLLREEAARAPFDVRIIVEPGCNIARGRNLAIRNTRFDIIAVTDAGCELGMEWMRHIVAPFEHDQSLDAVIGWSEPHPAGPAWPLAHAWLVVPRLEDVDPKAILPSSRSFAVRKELALRLGGYPEHLSNWAEDTLFCLNLTGIGARWGFAPEAVTFWIGPGSWGEFLRMRYHYQLGNGEARIYEQSAALPLRNVATMSLLMALTAGFLLAGISQPPLLLVALAWALLSAGYFSTSANTDWTRSLRSRWSPRHRTMLKPAAMGWLTAGADALGTAVGRLRSRHVVLSRLLDLEAETVVFPKAYEWFWMKQRPGHLAEAFARRGLQVVFCPNNYAERIHGGLLEVANRIVLCNDTGVLDRLARPIVYSVAAHHFRADSRMILKRARVAFDLVDEIGATNSTTEDLQCAARRAEVVFAASSRLAAFVKATTGVDAVLLQNAVDAELWQRRGGDAPCDLHAVAREGATIIGYSGALGFWFDFELLRETARARPDWRFVLIGPIMDGEAERELSQQPENVIHLGLKHHNELPAYIEHFRVGMIPFRLMEGTVAANPLKVYEYAAMEVPIVCTHLPECQVTESVQLARTPGEFLSCLEKFATGSNDPSLGRALRAVALRNTWDQRVETILDALQRAVAGASPDTPTTRLGAK